MTDTVTTEVVTVEHVVIETVEVAMQGPPGPQGTSGFTTAIDIIDGGTPTTDYSTAFIFDGGAP